MVKRKYTGAKKRSTTRKQRGKGVMDILKKVHSFVKSNKLISRGLALTPYKGAASAAAMLGYGRQNPLLLSLNGAGRRKKRRATTRRVPSLRLTTAPRRKRRSPISIRAPRTTRSRRSRTVYAPVGQVGSGFFSDLGGGLGSLASGIGHGLFGGGRSTGRRNPIAI